MRISKLNVDPRCAWARHKNSVTSSVCEYRVFYGAADIKFLTSQSIIIIIFFVGGGGGGASEKTI